MSLSFRGQNDFIQIGQPRWQLGGLAELDSVDISYQGGYTKLASFQSGLQKWSACPVDGNLFLETYTSDDDKVKPTVTVRYIGCKNGQLPPSAIGTGTSIQTISTTDGELQLEALYVSPYARTTSISTSPTSGSSGGTPAGEPVVLSRRIDGHVPSIYTLQQQAVFALALARAKDDQRAAINAALAAANKAEAELKKRVVAYFKSVFRTGSLTETQAEPLVPNRFWRVAVTTSKVLMPF